MNPALPARTIRVRVVADTRALRQQLLRAQLLFTRGWRRLPLRFKLWRISREPDPRV